MNDIQTKLLEQASDILTAVTNTVGKATDLAATQIPDIAMEYVLWGRATQTATFLIMTCILLVGLWLIVNVGCRDTCKLGRDSYQSDWHSGRITACLVGGGLTFIVSVHQLCALSSLFMVWFAPKVWLLKEISRLIH